MRRAFTLVEILVVFGIISLLAALAVPALQIVTARTNSAKCIANLRSLGHALNTYLPEHQMTMPTLAAGRHSTNEDLAVIDNTLDAYLSDRHIFACPEDAHLAKESGTSYYWNSALNGQLIANLNMFTFIKDASRIPVLVDKEGWHRNSEEKVNHLFADGHVSKELRLFAE